MPYAGQFPVRVPQLKVLSASTILAKSFSAVFVGLLTEDFTAMYYSCSRGATLMQCALCTMVQNPAVTRPPSIRLNITIQLGAWP